MERRKIARRKKINSGGIKKITEGRKEILEERKYWKEGNNWKEGR
jgi:hypothetical protein